MGDGKIIRYALLYSSARECRLKSFRTCPARRQAVRRWFRSSTRPWQDFRHALHLWWRARSTWIPGREGRAPGLSQLRDLPRFTTGMSWPRSIAGNLSFGADWPPPLREPALWSGKRIRVRGFPCAVLAFGRRSSRRLLGARACPGRRDPGHGPGDAGPGYPSGATQGRGDPRRGLHQPLGLIDWGSARRWAPSESG